MHVFNHIVVTDTLKENYSFSSNNIDDMMMDSSSAKMEIDDTAAITIKPMGNIQEVKETVYENEQKNSSNKKYHVIFKPKSSSISHRLQRSIFKKML